MNLPITDLIVIFIYLGGIIAFCSWFVRINRTPYWNHAANEVNPPYRYIAATIVDPDKWK
ncbi:MAG: hypothetical protein WD431_14670, partial [Cyclobacteriaceae bacterium]